MIYSNVVEIINIVKKYITEKGYIHGSNVDIFKLFDIDLNNEEDAIIKCQRLHELIRSDFVPLMPLKYRFEYKCILDTIMPYIPYEEDEVMEKLTIYKEKINNYNQSINNMSRKEYMQMLGSINDLYKNSYLQFLECAKDEIGKSEIKRSLRVMHRLIKRLKKSNDPKQDNIYELLMLVKHNKLESIKNSFWYDRLTDLPEQLVFNFYKQEYKASDSDIKYFDKIIDLIVMMENVYLDTEKTKKLYDMYLDSSKNNQKRKKSALLEELEGSYYNLRKYNIVDLFELFSIDSRFSSEEILDSEHYKKLEQLFSSEIDLNNKLHLRLLELFEEFQKILDDKEYRQSYVNLINRSKKINDERVNNDFQEYNRYKFVIDIVSEKYKKMIEADIFMDFYRLFNLNPNDNIETLNKNVSYLYKAFSPKFIIFIKDRETFMKIRDLLKHFVNNVINSQESKNLYDDKLYESRNMINYKFKQKKYKIKKRQRNVLRTYFRALENSLVRNGVDTTIELMCNYLDDGIGIEERCFSKLAFSDLEKIEKTLIKTFGPQDCIEETVKRSINYYINRKLKTLCNGIDSTCMQKGCEHTKLSLIYYMLTNNGEGFVPETKEEYGRENIECNVRPSMIRILAGAVLDDRELLNSHINDIDMDNINDRINAFTDYMIKKNHPALYKLHLLKK